MDKVLVIGGNGFVGTSVLQALAAAPAFQPISGVRSVQVRADAIEQRLCDATNVTQLSLALRGISYVVFCVLGSRATMVSAMRNILTISQRSGLRGLVLISSLSVYGARDGVLDESVPTEANLGDYALAKIECEQLAQKCADSGCHVTILRAGIVYGEGGQQWVGRIGRWLKDGRVGDLGDSAHGRCNLTYKDDLAAAVVASLHNDRAHDQIFNISEPNPLTWNAWFADLGNAIGIPRIKHIPASRLKAEAYFLGPPLQILKLTSKWMGLRQWRFYEPITPALLRLWRQDMSLNSCKANSILGISYTPRAIGIARSAKWFCGS